MTGSKRIDTFLNGREEKRSLPLKHRSRGFWLVSLYVPFLVVPWILTCVLAHRPISSSSYVYHKGFSDSEVNTLRNWKNAVDVLNSIAALLTIPFLSALLAQATVVFCQRTHSQQFLSLHDVFTLADRGWTNIPALWKAIWSRPNSSTSGTKWAGTFLLPAACLILIGAIQQPLYQILVNVEAIPVATCGDTKYQFLSRNSSHCTDRTSSAYRPLGIDIEPSQMDHVYHNTFLRRLKSDLESVSIDEKQPHLWSDYMPAESWLESRSLWSGALDEKFQSLRPWLSGFAQKNYKLPQFFVAGLSSNMTTGVLREHLMRFNSSITCELIDRASFPSSCPGQGPFTATLKKSKDTDIRVCVPGEIGTIPWTRSRNRQDITEQLYLEIRDGDFSGKHSQSGYSNISAAIRCEGKTTRGFFELGNIWNNDTYAGLLGHWPDQERMLYGYNDWVATSIGGAGFVPSERYSINTAKVFY